jgi:hypothetical protein
MSQYFGPNHPFSLPSDPAATIFPRGQWPNWQGTGLQNRRFQVRALAAPLHNRDSSSPRQGMNRTVGGIVAYVLFFIAGVGFGYAAMGKWRWLPLLFPLVLGLFALLKYGPDASVIIRLIVALAITAVGVLLGAAIDARQSRAGENPRYA